jgi:hypothetical protein
MRIVPSGALMFLATASCATKKVLAFTPNGLSLRRSFHKSASAINAEKQQQKQQQKGQKQKQQQKQGGEWYRLNFKYIISNIRKNFGSC